jgi:hypothetical protein
MFYLYPLHFSVRIMLGGTIDIEVYIDSSEKVSFFAEHIQSGQEVERPLAGSEHVLKAWLQRLSEK